MTAQRFVVGVVLALLTAAAVAGWAAESDEVERIRLAATVFKEIMAAPDRAIPNAILRRAEAIAVFPGTLKGGFIFGAHRGRGIISVRDANTKAWSAPAFLTLTGGSFGLQIGGQAVDVVLVIMNRRGLEKLLQNEFKIGADASAVAGPLGRDAEASTDILLQAEILSYSRTRGLFAGVTLKGSSIRADRDANERFYAQALETRAIVIEDRAGKPMDPDAVAYWRRTLNEPGP
jgi:lipid-binding SYLF domain-containing protein